MNSGIITIQIAAGILLAFFLISATVKGMAIHRANGGFKSAFGAALFIFGFIISGMVVILGALYP